jgi:multicomponent Na+:H+ antiporter subunit D
VAIAVREAADVDHRVAVLAGGVFFIVHNMVVKTALFLCGGLMHDHAGSDDLDRIGGLGRRAPWLAGMFFIASLSLAGLPPLSGFFGKLVLIREALSTGFYLLAGLAVATSVLTLLSMLKIWAYGYWSEPAGRQVEITPSRPRMAGGMAGIAILVVVALSMGLFADRYMVVCRAAAAGVVDTLPYRRAVLGDRATLPNTGPGATTALLDGSPDLDAPLAATPATLRPEVR